MLERLDPALGLNGTMKSGKEEVAQVVRYASAGFSHPPNDLYVLEAWGGGGVLASVLHELLKGQDTDHVVMPQ